MLTHDTIYETYLETPPIRYRNITENISQLLDEKDPNTSSPLYCFCNEPLIGAKYEKAYRNVGALHAERF